MNPVLNIGKRAVQAAARSLGLEIRRTRNELRMLQRYGCRTVLDVGANCGQFASNTRRLLPDAIIHSFEPLPDMLEALKGKMRGDSKFFAHGIALGKTEGDTVMYRNEFTPSSSLLRLGESHLRAFPFATRTVSVPVRIRRLDSWVEGYRLEHPLLIKLDVQGFEDQVIEGGRGTIATARVLIVEVSFVELYRGQRLFEDLYASLGSLGLRCVGMVGNILEPASGRILQADAVFERP